MTIRTAICLTLSAMLQGGCITPATPAPPLIIGQRVITPEPGATLTVPPLTPPARQWYLVDDIGLGIWLGIAPPISNPQSAIRNPATRPSP
jgi:hypothetical protein